MFGKASPLNLERVIEASVVHDGYRDDLVLPLTAWRTTDGIANLTGSTAPEITTCATSIECLKWDHGDANTDTIEIQISVPGNWAQDKDDLILVVPARKTTSSDEENANLCLQAQVFAFQPGRVNFPSNGASGTVPTVTAGEASLVTLTTPATALLAATSGANTNLTGFALYELNIGQRLIAEGKRIKAGATLKIVLGPNETVGSGDLDLEILAPTIRFRRHASMYNSLDRWLAKPLV